ncbi:hypothetical protein BDW02DRAFT_205710 [Decorospora gaudefroyi]|uniref:Uncharacterized protein n=1 Tax=Decorospora gaudefroyi TaxID=184978 RepID=A0A6A5K2J2_9PLEO|nr:hypothetical protein BDW02DRAFT_205710 [Decorospora gaudefroyi]
MRSSKKIREMTNEKRETRNGETVRCLTKKKPPFPSNTNTTEVKLERQKKNMQTPHTSHQTKSKTKTTDQKQSASEQETQNQHWIHQTYPISTRAASKRPQDHHRMQGPNIIHIPNSSFRVVATTSPPLTPYSLCHHIHPARHLAHLGNNAKKCVDGTCNYPETAPKKRLCQCLLRKCSTFSLNKSRTDDEYAATRKPKPMRENGGKLTSV